MGYNKVNGEWKKKDLQEVSSSSEQEEDTEEEQVPTSEPAPIPEDIPIDPIQETAPTSEAPQEQPTT